MASAEDDGRAKDRGPLGLLREHWQRKDLSDCDLLRKASGLRFLIVSVPDPNDTSVGHDFDSTIGAVLRAAESEGFVLERHAFSWDPNMQGKPASSPSLSIGQSPGFALALTLGNSDDRDRSWRGSILCRHVDGANDEKSDSVTKPEDVTEKLLLLLLVPETPAWGIDKPQLERAIELVKEHKKYRSKAGDRIGIVGPMYSGSFVSLAAAIKHCWDKELSSVVKSQLEKNPRIGEWAGTLGPMQFGPLWSPQMLVDCYLNSTGSNLKFTIINGSAQRPPDRTIQDRLFGRDEKWIKLCSTVHSQDRLVAALLVYLRETSPFGKQPESVALLVEAGSPFGLMNRRPAKGETPDLFAFPMGISRIRQEYTARGYYQPNEPIRLAAPERLSLQSMTGRTGDRDLMPAFSPGTAAVEGEVVLSQILQELERGRYTTIGIVATNVYDQLFLAYKLRQVCPDARLTFTSSSTLYFHPDIVPYLRGSLVVSTYPLQLANQSWSPGLKVGDESLVRVPRIGFPHDNSEGIYNATLANLAKMLPADGQSRPALLDYGFPGKGGADGSIPPIWVSVVGERGLYPLAVKFPTDDQNEYGISLYRSPSPQVRPEAGDLMTWLDLGWVGVYLAIAGITSFGAVWYMWACLASMPREATCLQVGPRTGEPINTQAGRQLAALAASAALGQVILQGLPAWGFARVLADHESGNWPTTLEMVLDERWLVVVVGVLAGLVLLAASLVAIFRLARGLAGEACRAGDRVSGAGVLLIAFLQVVLPLFFVAQYLTPSKNLTTWNVADLRLDCERMSRLTNGVTPLMSLMLIGLAIGFALFGGWRRIRFLARLGAVNLKNDSAKLSGPAAAFGPVRSYLQEIHKTLDAPLMMGTHGGPWLLPALGLSVLVGTSAIGRLPVSFERRGLYGMILAAFVLTTLMIMLRLIELIGLWRLNARLLHAAAQLPMVRAFERLPTRPAAPGALLLSPSPEPLSGTAAPKPSLPAAETADPLIDRQFQSLVAGYGRVQATLYTHGISTSTDGDPIDQFLRRPRTAGARPLLPADWWRAVDAMVPILSPFWARRSAITAYAVASGAGASLPDTDAEWPGLDELTSIGRPVDVESGPDLDRSTGEGRAATAVQVLREAAVATARRPGPTASPEEVRRWLRDAEDFIALVLARQLAWIRRYCSAIETFLVVGLLSLTLAVTSYPFQPRGQMLAVLGLLATATAATVIVIAVQLNRDDVTSRINKLTPNRFTLDRQFVMTLVTVVMPLLGLLAALSYGTSDLIRSWLEPLFR